MLTRNNLLFLDIHYWRTKSKAEVDFVIYKNKDTFIPIEVKFQNFKKPVITRGFRSFIEAYNPKFAIIITKNFINKIKIDDCEFFFIPLIEIKKVFMLIKKVIL